MVRKNELKRVKDDGDQMNLDISILVRFKLDLKTLSAREGRKYDIVCTAGQRF